MAAKDKETQNEILQAIHRARAERNWESLIEIGKALLNKTEFDLAIECFIEARHLNKDDPITHKHLGDAYWAEAQALQELNNSGRELQEKAHKCYLDALSIAEAQNDMHFLTEFRQELLRKDVAL